jgi:predicted O-methyltransferase YrrM
MDYYTQFKNQQSNRDPYFNYTLSLFNRKPINILELGCARDFNSRLGDGWSSFHFLEYISKYGGSFTTIDLVQQNVENCITMLRTHPKFDDLKSNLNFLVGDALKVLEDKLYHNENTHLIYLDVSDDPVLTMQCFEKMNLDNSVVFVDDFSSKGTILSQKYPNHLEMTWPAPIGHKMALYKRDQIKARIIVDEVEKH